MKLIVTLFLVSLLSLTLPPVFSQNSISDTTKLEKKISILNEKIFANFPATAVVSPRVADIMAADPNENKETRIIYDIGNMKLVLFAQELFSFTGNKLFEDISKQEEPDFNFQRKELTNADSIITVLSTPTLFDTSASAILVNSLLVKTPDNTVCRIDAYINPPALNSKDEYIRLTENIFKTISKGNRRISLEAREETFKIPGTTGTFSFKLPKNYFVTIDEKYDFSVFKINQFKHISDTTYTSLTIYTGRYPTHFYKEYGLTEDKSEKTKGIFLEKSIDWLYFKDDSHSFFLKEQVVPAEELSPGLVMHIALLSNKKSVIDELSEIVKTIKMTRQ